MRDNTKPPIYYAEIFRHNGASYHTAMESYPDARNEEFAVALSLLSLAPEQTLLDIPAGGGYLKKYLAEHTEYLAYDFSGGFGHDHQTIKQCTETSLDLADNSVDRIVCLAALHHIENRNGFYQELIRVLRPSGTLVLGDVIVGSPQDAFLNQFVDRWNKLGHQGVFLDRETDIECLQDAGFDCQFQVCNYPWVFGDIEQARDYFRLLFSMNLNPSDDALDLELDKLQGKTTGSAFTVNWQLGFITATPAN